MSTPEGTSPLERYATGLYRPATFLERGVTLPFTTQMLLGGRIRPAQRGGAELILANPSGTEGVYVLPWSAVPDFCTASLHDRALWARVADLPMLAPRNVRRAAQAVAAEGYAGRAAARAATRAEAAARESRTLMHYGLLLELVRQGEPRGASGKPPPEADTPANIQERAHAVLDRLRAEGRIAPAAALDAIEELAEVFEEVGLGRAPSRGRLPGLADAIAGMASEMAQGAGTDSPTERICFRLLAQSAELVLRCGRIAIAEAHALKEDVWGLLQRWRVAPDEIRAIAARAEWIFDGWDVILGLWQSAPEAQRPATTLEMAPLVPLIPAEVKDWLGFDASIDMEGYRSGLRRWRRSVRANEDWMTGRIMDAAHRNEQVRAQSA